MKAGIALLDHLNCEVEGGPFPLLQDTSGHPIIPSKGDFFRKGEWNYIVDGIYWDYDEQSVVVVATEIYGQRPTQRPK
jgi:hypothetical protein